MPVAGFHETLFLHVFFRETPFLYTLYSAFTIPIPMQPPSFAKTTFLGPPDLTFTETTLCRYKVSLKLRFCLCLYLTFTKNVLVLPKNTP